MLGVTLFGIFLTPVFFYVICGLSETRLFMAVAMQWIGSILLGSLLGAGIGFSLSRIGLVDPTWALAAGAGLGILGAMILQTVHRRVVGGAPPGDNQPPPVSETNVPDDNPRVP
jgi:multidrug efflux pump